MKDVQLLRRYTIPPRNLAAGWGSPLWEDFAEEEFDNDEPPLDAEWGDVGQREK